MANLDITLLRIMRRRDRFAKYSKAIPQGVVSTHTQAILADFSSFFLSYKDADVVGGDEFLPFFKLRHPKLTEDTLGIYMALLPKVFEPGPADVEDGIMDKIIQIDTANKVTSLVQLFMEGGDVELLPELARINEEAKADVNKKVKTSEVNTPIEEMMDEEASDRGLHWRLACLNESMRPLRGGDFGIVAGRPDKGKTSFLTSELTFMAAQVEALYPNESRSIIWFNNEGPGKRIKYRCYQSALNMTSPELVKFHQETGKMHAGYVEAIGGRMNLIRIFDIHDHYSWEVEDIINSLDTPPALIVMDMVDNIKFSGGVSNNGQRTDQLLEAMYGWARNLSVKLDVPIIATSQISAAGDGMSYPTLPMLKDSQTGKQGACEFIITLGAMNDPGYQASRFIGATKNKLHRFGGPKDPRCEVTFDGLRGRYNMPTESLPPIPTE